MIHILKRPLLLRFTSVTTQNGPCDIHRMKPLPSPSRAEAATPAKALINRKQLAAAASVSLRTVDEWRERGIIPFLKINGIVRFDFDEVMTTLRARYGVHRQEGGRAL